MPDAKTTEHDASTTQPDVAAFEGDTLLLRGSREAVSALVRSRAADATPVYMFDLASGRTIEPDAPKSDWVQPEAPRSRGRPKLGVVAREVTLLPRHWDWLGAQPGGASAAVRRLVDAARKEDGGAMSLRAAQEATYRFMTTMAGDRPNYEEAVRALYARDAARFETLTEAWPPGVKQIAREFGRRAVTLP